MSSHPVPPDSTTVPEESANDSAITPDHPSYTFAKVPEMAPFEPPPAAHFDRNQFMEELVPSTYPQGLPYLDSQTGLNWIADRPVGEVLYHGGNECIRATATPEMTAALASNPDYRDAFQAMAGSYDFSVDAVVPGAQACYVAGTGELVQSGPHVGTWDFASPDVPGQNWAHWVMDMEPDHHADQYTPVPSTVPAYESHHTATSIPESGNGSFGGSDSGYGSDSSSSASSSGSSSDAGSGGGSGGSE